MQTSKWSERADRSGGDYDFTTLVKRRRSSLIDVLMPPVIRDAGVVSFLGAEPLYATAPVICEAVMSMARNGRFGFTVMDKGYQDAVVSWMQQARDCRIEPDWIVPTLGTIHSVAVAIRLFTRETECVIITPPVYNRYEQAATRLNRKTIHCPLIIQDGRYIMDFAAIEQAMARPDTHLFILCNPHNPIGQIWQTAELTRLAHLAARYDVCVFADEIFAENSLNGHNCPCYLTIPQAAEHCIVATSLGKAFGTTGFNHANMLIPAVVLRDAFLDRRTREHYGSMDPVAYECLLAAYTPEGLDWIQAGNRVIETNMQAIRDFCEQKLPDVPVYGGEGGYILWLDWRSRFTTEADLVAFLQQKAFLHADTGSSYGSPGYIRLSLACPHHCVQQALQRLAAALDDLE